MKKFSILVVFVLVVSLPLVAADNVHRFTVDVSMAHTADPAIVQDILQRFEFSQSRHGRIGATAVPATKPPQLAPATLILHRMEGWPGANSSGFQFRAFALLTGVKAGTIIVPRIHTLQGQSIALRAWQFDYDVDEAGMFVYDSTEFGTYAMQSAAIELVGFNNQTGDTWAVDTPIPIQGNSTQANMIGGAPTIGFDKGGMYIAIPGNFFPDPVGTRVLVGGIPAAFQIQGGVIYAYVPPGIEMGPNDVTVLQNSRSETVVWDYKSPKG